MNFLRTLITALALVMTLGLMAPTANAVSTPVPASATFVPASIAITTAAPSTAVSSGFSSYGCLGLLNIKQAQVMVFAAGYCPSVWVLQNTPWGRSVTNWVVNGLCRMPWIVRAATRGRYSTC